MLGNKHPSYSEVVLRLQLHLGQCASLNSLIVREYDNMQYSLLEFYCKCLDDGNMCYGPFIRLPRESQELSLCCVYYFSYLDLPLLKSIASCCLYPDLDPNLLFRIVEVLHSTYRDGHINIADHLRNLSFPPQPAKPELIYTNDNSVSLTIAESNRNFDNLIGNYPRDANEFHPLVPKLTTSYSLENKVLPLLAIQVTVFPNIAFGIHSSYTNKLTLPSYNRASIIDNLGLEEVFWKEFWKRRNLQEIVIGNEANVDLSNMVRGTFVMGSIEMEKIKQRIIVQCTKKNQSKPVHLSPYVLACAFLWVCLLKTKTSVNKNVCFKDPCYFGFVAGGMTRLDYPVPATYFGNCVGFGRLSALRSELLGDDGIVVAAKAIGSTVKKLDKALFGEAEKWISDWEVLFGSELHVVVVGSPKLDFYETDFGWGRPKKTEEICIDRMRAISLTESRDLKGGIEIGLVLPKAIMETFTNFYTQGLNSQSPGQVCSLSLSHLAFPSLPPTIAMAPVSSHKALAVVLVVAIFSAVASAQDFNLSPSPAPAPDAGAAGSVSTSMAVIGSSFFLSMLAILKQ
ncbi:Malonyl-coenzyme:anthocyanin 5-O-glucoside-6'''-O-malonyltransferase [Quillaja saponaria]|uniref:Malonyl-coenzyme:anthocyanin 5-O-glucoside-6'''-O-malonyltransferase n=1 Tax=Quillaja saponaria TaxID=32244 RepID=A0AAD7L0F4_QUISA|nr:Malonyl-coenzyme:anthocyanin 5-O-glucoside-6'''-O-malonyltransferase [Quillaja saponaria]